MEQNIAKVYEMMHKLNPEFNINEDSFPTFNSSGQNQENTQGQSPKTSDAKLYDKYSQKATTLNNAGSKINTAIEFPEAFKSWFNKLGYSPEKSGITIARVLVEVKKVMQELGYR